MCVCIEAKAYCKWENLLMCGHLTMVVLASKSQFSGSGELSHVQILSLHIPLCVPVLQAAIFSVYITTPAALQQWPPDGLSKINIGCPGFIKICAALSISTPDYLVFS